VRYLLGTVRGKEGCVGGGDAERLSVYRSVRGQNLELDNIGIPIISPIKE
jgi:hypothetical protein